MKIEKCAHNNEGNKAKKLHYVTTGRKNSYHVKKNKRKTITIYN